MTASPTGLSALNAVLDAASYGCLAELAGLLTNPTHILAIAGINANHFDARAYDGRDDDSWARSIRAAALLYLPQTIGFGRLKKPFEEVHRHVRLRARQAKMG